MFKRAAISLSAFATSSACARLSSAHGPAMIEIGRSLPNLTGPALTIAAAETCLFNASSLIRRDNKDRVRRIKPYSQLEILELHRRLEPAARPDGRHAAAV